MDEPALVKAAVIDVTNCARCGNNHIKLRFEPLTQPTYDGWTFWAPCPTNGEPILMQVAEEKEDRTVTVKQS